MSQTEDTLSGLESTANEPELQIDEARRRAAQFGYPFADLGAFREDVSVWQQIPMDSILRYRVVPLREEGESLVIAVGEPARYRELDELERGLGRPLVIEVAAPFQIEEILARNRTSFFLIDNASDVI